MGYLVLFPKARCEEDVDLFRDIMYMLLGLLMNLCLQSPFVSEVQYSFLPTWNLGQPDHNLWHRTFSFSQIGRSPWTPALAVGMGQAGWMLCHFPEGQMSHLAISWWREDMWKEGSNCSLFRISAKFSSFQAQIYHLSQKYLILNFWTSPEFWHMNWLVFVDFSTC